MSEYHAAAQTAGFIIEHRVLAGGYGALGLGKVDMRAAMRVKRYLNILFALAITEFCAAQKRR